MEQLLDWDQSCFIFLNSIGNHHWDPFFLTVTLTTIWFPLFVYFIWLAFDGYTSKEFYSMILTTAVMVLLVAAFAALVKYSVARPRPYLIVDLADQIRALKPISGYSFFSGHAASSFSITTLLWLFFKKQKPWFVYFFFWPILYSFSRIYIGVHFPLDSFVGASVGVGAAFLFYRLYIIKILPVLSASLNKKELL
jgi:undecaprenyl-diphosphatase